MTKKDLEIREQAKKEENNRIYNLIVGLYQEETNAYNKYMANNPDDKQRIDDHILIGATYCKILYLIREE